MKVRRLTKAQTTTIRAMGEACDGLDEPTREAVEQQFAHLKDPTFNQRLHQLASDTATAIPGATGDTEVWAGRVVRHRNRFAHNLEKQPTLDFYEMLALWRSLRWLLCALLLAEATVAVEILAGRIRTNQQWLNFISSAPRHAPNVYTRADDYCCSGSQGERPPGAPIARSACSSPADEGPDPAGRAVGGTALVAGTATHHSADRGVHIASTDEVSVDGTHQQC
jgi:hypothetical protein